MTNIINIKGKTLVISVLLTLLGILFMQGCSSNNMYNRIDNNCPTPTKDQLDYRGALMLQEGVTLKCQIKNNASLLRLPCIGITDEKNNDGWACNYGNGKDMVVFIFDESGILKKNSLPHEIN